MSESQGLNVRQLVIVVIVGILLLGLFLIFTHNKSKNLVQNSARQLTEISQELKQLSAQVNKIDSKLVVAPKPVPTTEVKKASPFAERCVPLQEGHGGAGVYTLEKIKSFFNNPRTHNAYEELLQFTGLSIEELNKRLQRVEQFHFESEHAWWNPQSYTELTWYYRTSVSYLFANAIHFDISSVMPIKVTPENGPILDYSAGVGNNIIGFALLGINTTYFGIGAQERDFAKFRVESRGLSDRVEFIGPYKRNENNNLVFDPIYSVPNKQFGGIICKDVLEHIPNYHITLKHLISVLRPGGFICENTPFYDKGTKMSIHQKASMPMSQAMVGMTLLEKHPVCNIWIKK